MVDMARTSKEYQSFTSLLDRLLSVPKAELDRRVAEHRKRAGQNPRNRGPKRKVERG
jgi:hypothetical protein